MLRKIGVLGVAVVALGLAGCGGTDTPTAAVASSTDRGTLVDNPPLRVASLDASDLGSELSASTSGQQLVELAGTPTCGVDFYYIKFWTIANSAPGQDAPLMDSAALMVPTGSAAPCTGQRPIVEYAHGTTTDSAYNIADIADTSNSANTESVLIAAVFAAQGYIVVAPNFAGYDISNLGYHPYLNAAQNSAEMMDALAAARAALPNTFTPATTDSGTLFLTGYSEGGYVAMATARAMQAAGDTVTAAAPMSGPYALEAFGDAVFFGDVNIDSTVFAPLITTSYQKAYGNIYTQPSDFYSAQYANGIETLLPSATPITTIFQEGLLPEAALFDSQPDISPTIDALLAPPANNPVADAGFGVPFLINDSARVAYLEDALANPDGAVPTPTAGVPLAASPQYPLRQDFKTNDLRNWTPKMPMLLCGGSDDPTVYFSVNTDTMAAYWAPLVSAGQITVLDLNATPQSGSPFSALQVALQDAEAQLVAADGEAVALESFHTTEAPFCTVAARGFFSQF